MITPPRKRYSLTELLEGGHSSHLKDAEAEEWLNVPPVGREFGSENYERLERSAESDSNLGKK